VATGWIGACSTSGMRSPRVAPFTQGVFYLATGLWPIVHFRSFHAVTHPRYDRRLMKAIGGLTAVLGVTLIAGAFEKKPSSALKVLGIGSAIALAAADVVAVARRRISTRLAVANIVAEGGIVGGWLATN
jgi:hypothetical protein